MGLKSELADQQQDQQREKEGIYENIRSLSRELALCELVINNYIPKEYQTLIDKFTNWNEDIGEWQLKCVAYSGNNMRKNVIDQQKQKEEKEFIDLNHVYLSYNVDGLSEPIGPQRARTARPKTGKASGVPRYYNRAKLGN